MRDREREQCERRQRSIRYRRSDDWATGDDSNGDQSSSAAAAWRKGREKGGG
jgi:hypothetical protein